MDYGAIATGTDGDIVVEIGILVNSLTVSATREKKVFKGTNGSTAGLRFQDPLLTFDFDGYLAALGADDPEDSIAHAHPGTSVGAIANYTGAIYGFDPADGILVLEDPSRQLSNEELGKATAKIVQYPFVA